MEKCIVIVLVAVAILYSVKSLQEFTFTREDSKSGMVPDNGSPTTVRSFTDCADLCGKQAGCQGFYHTETLKECSLSMSENTSNFTRNSHAVYFVKDVQRIVVSITSLPTVYHTDILLQGTHGHEYPLTILQVYVTLDEAVKACTDLGLQLMRVTDDNKTLDLAEFLSICNVYNMNGYWTDLERHVNQLSASIWRNSDGSGVSCTGSIWCSGQCSLNLAENCTRMNRDCSYKLGDIHCGNNRHYGVICE